jgi:hypothetical protein
VSEDARREEVMGWLEHNRSRVWVALGAICLLSALARLPLLWGGFIRFDDWRVIYSNLIVTDLTWANFQEVTFANYMGTASSFMFAVDMLNWAATPNYTGFAVFNMIWMAGTVLLFFRFSGLFLRAERWRLVATALFAVESVNADTIGWMSARCHFLALAFVLGCFILWQRYLEEPRPVHRALFYLFAVVAGCWAIWSKSVFVTVGGLLFVYDWYKRRRPTPAFFLDKIPLFAAAAYAVTQPPNSLVMAGVARPSMGSSFASTLYNDASLLVEYLRRMLVPGPNSVAVSTYPVDGPWETSAGASLLAMRLPPAVNIAILAAMTVGIYLLARRTGRRALWYAFVMLVLAFAPSMNIPPRWVEFAFRFAWLPSVFFCVAAAAALEGVWDGRLGSGGRAAASALAVGCLAFWIAGHATATFRQSATMKDDRYWDNCIRNVEDSLICYMKAADLYTGAGDTDGAIRVVEKWDHLSSARTPIRRYEPAYRLARLYEGKHDKRRACEYYERALSLDQLSADQRRNASTYVRSCGNTKG